MNLRITYRLNNKKRLVLLAFFYLAFTVACSKQPSRQLLQFDGPTMGTRYSVKLVVPSGREVNIEILQAKVDERLVQINQSMSTYISDSELNLFNASEVDQSVRVSAELCSVLELAQTVAVQTNGAFDISVGPLVKAWGFGPDKRDEPPQEDVLEALLSRTGYHFLEVDCEALEATKRRDLSLDLSAIAKGYAVDVIADLVMREAQVGDVMVEIGGELALHGFNVEAKPWAIGIEKPALGHSGASQVLELSDVAVATSGDYRNFYEYQGQHYSHLIDPLSGQPVDHALTSVTIVSGTCAEADAYATAVHVLGPEKGLAFAQSKKLAAFFIERSEDGFRYYHTSEFEQYMRSL